MSTLNLGILAHVDAGKTSLTERLLYAAGVIDEVGSVDDGSTQTDSLALERQRGITIRAAVVSLAIGDVRVNLIDTPGHPDFIAEVERVLSVLDGAVLVVSAVEGIQAQTRILLRALQRLRIPTLIFVNKIDRPGAQGTLMGIAGLVPMGTATELGTRRAGFIPAGAGGAPALAEALAEVLAEHDDGLLAAFVRDELPSYRQLRSALAAQTRRALVHPVYFGSAITGAGVEALMAGLTELLPRSSGSPDAPPAGTVFKVERGLAGEKIAYLRLFAGTVRTRDRLRFERGNEGKVTAIGGGLASITAGEIGRLHGLADVRIGDTLGPVAAGGRHFAPPTLESVVVPARPAERGAVHAALSQLAEQDPLIHLRQDLTVSLYGEVQKEVIQATLATGYGLAVTFRETTTICVERVAGTGSSFQLIGVAPNPYLATVGLRVEPAPDGVSFDLEVELGSMPPAFFRAVEESVRATLRSGLCGWDVQGCRVTMTHSGYWARQSHMGGTFDKSMSSTAGDFRNLTRLVLREALAEAGTTVHEPILRFHLEAPADTYGALLPVLSRHRAVPQGPVPAGSWCTVDGEVPAAEVLALQRQLPGLTRGEGALETAFSHYSPVMRSHSHR